MGTQKNAPLPDGLELHGYRILRKIASGGFSIVYLAEDDTGRQVAIKEYLPSNLVKRDPGELVPHVPPKNLPTYRNGLKCFFEEGRALVRIFHPNVVHVNNFFKANGTVYLVMDFVNGRSLQEIVLRHRSRAGIGSKKASPAKPVGDESNAGKAGSEVAGVKGGPEGGATTSAQANASSKASGGSQAPGVLPERHVIHVFGNVMNGLREVHANRMLHLDLKPANIYLRMDGSPLLLDFGAARRTLDSDSPKLFPMYTPGFAAPELHGRHDNLGPWTDIYGIGTSMYACMAGIPPQAADQRRTADELPAAIERLAGAYSPALLDIVAWCVKLDPAERPQSVFALQRALRALAPPAAAPKPWFVQWWSRLRSKRKSPKDDAQHSIIVSG